MSIDNCRQLNRIMKYSGRNRIRIDRPGSVWACLTGSCSCLWSCPTHPDHLAGCSPILFCQHSSHSAHVQNIMKYPNYYLLDRCTVFVHHHCQHQIHTQRYQALAHRATFGFELSGFPGLSPCSLSGSACASNFENYCCYRRLGQTLGLSHFATVFSSCPRNDSSFFGLFNKCMGLCIRTFNVFVEDL